MRLLLLAALAAVALPAAAQTRVSSSPGALVVSGGTAGSAMRVSTQATRPASRTRLSDRYRGVAVNRSPRTIAHGPTPGGFVSGDIVMPALRTPQGPYVRRGNTAFPVARRH